MKIYSAFPGRTFWRVFIPLVAAIVSLAPAHALDITVAPGGNIQSAIDQVNAAGGGSAILQAGTHTIAASLLMRSGVTLKGAGAASTTIQNTGGAANYSLITGPAAGITSITIRDLALDGRNSAGGGGIFFDGADYTSNINLNFINLEVRNITSMGIHPKAVTGLTQINNYIHDSGRVSLAHNQYFRRVNDLNVSGSRFANSPAGDGAKFTVWDGATVTNNTFTGNRNRGLRTQDVNANGSFTYNTMIGNAWDGLEITGDTTTITFNAAYNNGWDTASSFRYGIRTPGGNGFVQFNNSYGNGGPNYDIHGAFNPSNNATIPAAFSIIQAENYSAMSGIQVGSCTDAGGGQEIGYISTNDYLVYSGVNLTGVTSLDARLSCGNTGGTIEVRLDGVGGSLVGTVTVTGTGSWSNWVTKNGAINGASGIRNVYLVFKSPSYTCNLNWIQFK